MAYIVWRSIPQDSVASCLSEPALYTHHRADSPGGSGKERQSLRGGAWSRCPIDVVTIPLTVAMMRRSGCSRWSHLDRASHHGHPFAHVGKCRDPGRRGPTRRPLDDLERKLACAQGGHHEAPPLIGRVGLVVAPAAERDQLIQVEVGAALGALDHVVDGQAASHTAGLTAPAGTREHLLPNGRPLGPACGPAASRPPTSR